MFGCSSWVFVVRPVCGLFCVISMGIVSFSPVFSMNIVVLKVSLFPGSIFSMYFRLFVRIW